MPRVPLVLQNEHRAVPAQVPQPQSLLFGHSKEAVVRGESTRPGSEGQSLVEGCLARSEIEYGNAAWQFWRLMDCLRTAKSKGAPIWRKRDGVDEPAFEEPG